MGQARRSDAIYDGRRFFKVRTRPKVRRFASLDTEDDTKGKVLLAVFHDGEQARVFRSPEPALEFLFNLSLRQKLILTAHNLEYDLCNLFQGRLRLLDWHFFGGRLMSATLPGTRITFWDSLNHSYHSPLSKLGESLGIPKTKSDYGWTKGRVLTDRDIEYCVQDARIVVDYMNAQQELYQGIGAEMKTTTPATALDFWRRNYLDGSIASLTDSTRAFFKRAYYGGRVEIFRMKNHGRIHYVDINSLYPYAMQGPYPDIDALVPAGKYGVVDAIVAVPGSCDIPPLPVRHNGKLVFPVGRFRGQWCSCELEYAQSLGVVVELVYGRLGSESLTYPFREYVGRCYDARLGSKSPLERTMWKLLMNSLYGKFGTTGNAQRLVDPESIPVSERTGREFLVGDLMCVDEETEPPMYANILWAAWTTALARIQLHKALISISEQGGIPLYCDTDSVIYKAPRRKPLVPIGKKLGAWKLEAEIEEFEAKCPKVYRFVTKDGVTVKAKGVPRDVQELFFSKGRAGYRKPLRMREAARRGKIPNLWIDTEKSLQSTYDKRILLPSGDSLPLALSM